MSTTTTNYGLVKPQLTDPADITALNGNWDKLDQVIKENKDYTDTKISQIPTPDVSGQIKTHDEDASAHGDIRTAVDEHISNKNNPHGITAEQIGAAKSTHTHTEYAPKYSYGTTDLVAGESILADGKLHFVYE